MTLTGVITTLIKTRLARFTTQSAGSISVELVVVLPMLLWALAATAVFYDGFRARYHAEASAQTVADVMSRETDIFSANYLEGLTNVYDYLNGDAEAARMRVTSVIWDPENNRNIVQWSYGSRGMLPLPPNAFALMQSGDTSGLLASMLALVGAANGILDLGGNLGNNGLGGLASGLGGDGIQDLGAGFSNGLSGLSGSLINDGNGVYSVINTSVVNMSGGPLTLTPSQIQAMMPVDDLASRIPPVLPGEALLVVETFSNWTPFAAVGVMALQFDPVVVVRPRFSPWINFAGVDPIYPIDDYEIDWTIDDDDDTQLPPVDPPPDPTGSILSQTFETGPANLGWSVARVTPGGPTGSFFGPLGSETLMAPVTRMIDLGASSVDARIEFDLLILDDWDGYTIAESNRGGDAVQFLFNGERISMEVFEERGERNYSRIRSASVYIGGSLITYTITPTRLGDSFYGSATSRDQIWQVSMLIQNPPQTFSFGFSASLSAAITNEAYGFDNFTVSTVARASQNPTAFVPGAGTLLGDDAITRMQVHSGCPDSRFPTTFVSFDGTDIPSSIMIERNAGGTTAVNTCSNVLGWGQVNATPALILNYDAAGTTNDLLIQGDDGNHGYSCDTTLMVRDPHGQWSFNDDYRYWNAGVVIPRAITGRYEVWLGTYGRTPCTASINITRR